jgi:hypothetical protein
MMNACEKEFHPSIDRHFARKLSRSREARLRAHLPTCTSCRAYYQGQQLAEKLDPRGDNPRERLAAALGLPAPGKNLALRWRLAAVVLVGATACVLLLAKALPPHEAFIARGASTGLPSAGLEVAVYRMKSPHEAERVGEHVLAQDELAFAYRNESGKPFLMIFAVDTAGRVAWYHPAWTEPSSNPKAVAITKQVGFKELPEAVRQPLQGDTITLHALFMDRPLDVRSVEQRVANVGSSAGLADPAAGEIDRTLVLKVLP